MHEISIAQSILSIAQSAVPENNTAPVSGVEVQVGELSGIEIESLQFAFSIIKADTLLKDAELNIRHIKGEAECAECHTVYACSNYTTACPSCNSYFRTILKGKEMKVTSITLDE